MTLILCIIFLIQLSTMAGQDNGDCCAQQKMCHGCDYIVEAWVGMARELDCEFNNWCRVPECKSSQNVQHLLLYVNQITSLLEDSLSCYRNVTLIDLSSNSIYHIHPAAFQGLPQLRKILLNENSITYIEPGTFSGLLLLTLLLNVNPLRCDALKNIPLKTSELALPSQCQAGQATTACQTATISGCCTQPNMCQKCEYIGRELFCFERNWCNVPGCSPSQNVELLWLFDNQITTLQEHSLSCYQNVTSIDLSENSIYQIHHAAFRGLSKLSTINLHENDIMYIESGTFALIPLMELTLEDNPLDCRATDNIPLDIESLTLPSQCSTTVMTGLVTPNAGNVGAATTQVFMSVNFIMVILHVLHR